MRPHRHSPLVVGLGGTTRTASSSERLLRIALDGAAATGASVEVFSGPSLMIPLFDPRDPAKDPNAIAMIEAIRRADGIIIASPGYHGSISGLIKNALDYVEYLRDDVRPYFEGRAIGCIACASGWQATGSTLAALRAVVHALRGWPTPLGAGVNSAEIVFNQDGSCANSAVSSQLADIGRQVVQFARQSAAEKILQYQSAEDRASLECANARV